MNTPPTVYPPHPAAGCFRPLTGADWKDFLADVRAKGVLHPAIVAAGVMLDGLQRQRACLQLGIPLPVQEWDGEGGSPTEYVISANLQRRQLDPEMSDECRAALWEVLQAEAAGRMGTGTLASADAKGKASSKLGKVTGQSQATVERQRRIETQGIPALVAAWRAKEISTTAAAALAGKSPAEQQRGLIAAAEARASKRGRTTGQRGLQVQIERLLGRLVKLIARTEDPAGTAAECVRRLTDG